MDKCMICLESHEEDSFPRITTLSREWLEGKMQRIIEKHLWWWYFKPASATSIRKDVVRWICRQCWQEILNFHRFFCKVEKAHRDHETISKSLELENWDEEQIAGDNAVKQELEDVEYSNRGGRNRVRTRKQLKTIKNLEDDEMDAMEVKSETYFSSAPPSDNGQEEEKDLICSNNEALSFETLDVENFEDFKEEFYKLENDEDNKLLTRRLKQTKGKSKVSPDGKKLPKNLKQIKPKVKLKDKTHNEEKEKSQNIFEEEEHKLECCICNISLQDFRAVKQHFRREHSSKGYAMCCGKKYFKRCLLIDHLRVHKDPNFFKCSECAKNFATRRGLEMHLEIHSKSRERKFNCEQCGKSYFKLHVFERHKLSHVPESERQFNCSQCDKKFASNYLRRQHEDLTHAKKYNKICDICGKTFRHSFSFQRHMEEHTGAAPPPMETCEICGAKITNKYGLRQHMKMRHLEENMQEQKCPYCSRISPNLNAHRMHIKYSHTMQRKHACHLCEKAFRRPLELKEHLSTHTGEALYTCPHCPRTFVSNANMHKHRKIAHRQEWEEARLKKLNEKGSRKNDNLSSSSIDNKGEGIQKLAENLVVSEMQSEANLLNF